MVLTIKIKCSMCGNRSDSNFYVMPLDETTKTGDYVHSMNHYRIQCKKCGSDFIFTIKFTPMKRKCRGRSK